MKRTGILILGVLAFAGVSFGQMDKKQEPRMRKDHKAPQKMVIHDSKKLKTKSHTSFAAQKIGDFRHVSSDRIKMRSYDIHRDGQPRKIKDIERIK